VSGALALGAKKPPTAEEVERAKTLPSLIANGFALLGVLACGVVGVLLAAVDLVLQSSAGSWVGLVLGSAIGLGCTVLSLRSPRASGSRRA